MKEGSKEGEYGLMYFLCKNEYRIFKPVGITIREELGRKEEDGGDELIQDIIHMCMEIP
jgi:hypothetical protein